MDSAEDVSIAISETAEKTVALLSTALDVSTALNVMGHLALGLGAACPTGLIRSPFYRDADGVEHRGVSAWPLIILKTRPSKLRAALDRVRMLPDVVTVDYPREVLTTSTDEELIRALRTRRADDLDYLGVMAHGPIGQIDAVFRGFSLVERDLAQRI